MCVKNYFYIHICYDHLDILYVEIVDVNVNMVVYIYIYTLNRHIKLDIVYNCI